MEKRIFWRGADGISHLSEHLLTLLAVLLEVQAQIVPCFVKEELLPPSDQVTVNNLLPISYRLCSYENNN